MNHGGQLQISVLGPVTVADGDSQIDLGARLRRLLAALVAAEGDVVSSDRLVDIVWSGEPPAGADRTLRTYVTRLRKALPAGREDVIVHRSPGYLIDLADGELDATAFDSEVEQAISHLRVGEIDEADTLLRTAVARWRGAAYAGFEHEEWARPQAVRLEERRLEAEEASVEVLLSSGRSEAAVAEARRLSAAHPLREQPQGLLMRALYGAGRRAEALRVVSEFRRYLVDETGLDPSAELTDLEDRIVRDDPDLATAARALRSYELAEKIGEGAFATVHRATQPGLDREVAVKIIRAELADRPDFVRRFEVEARTIARIEHPNVVPLYDFWREPGAAYLVMRLLRGGTVEQAVRARGAYSRDQVARLLSDIGPALETAHRQGLVHRDVKPANLLLDDQSNTYLADFGIALPTASMDTMSVLSPAYAAPEVIRGEAAGPAADILSLGVTVFEVLTGRLPFESSTSRAELIDKQINEPLPPVRSTRTDLPAAVDEVLARATAKAPGDRHATVSALVEDLHLALADGVAPRRTGDRQTATMVDADAPNPYVGLHAFDEADADRFRGRDALVTELVEAVELNRLVTVVGPSGSGKSSVVRAGLLPAVRRGGITGSGDWFVTTMLPGNDPVDALETALLRIAVNPPASLREQLAEDGGLLRAVRRVLPDDRAELLLVIDQFEELFTQVESDDDRIRFLDELAAAITAPGSPLRVVSTIRADHYDAPLRHAAMAELVHKGTVAVRPMSPAELEQAIVAPAQAVGVEVEQALVAELVAGVSQRPAGLPLLQFALTEAYDRRTAGVMTLDTHRKLGGLAGALAARAERILETGGQADIDAARRIFGRLVTLGEGAEDTRRRTLRSELGDDERTAWILDAFASARLLTFDRDETTRTPTVEVAHEALLRDWPRLRGWLADDRADIRTLQGISAATAAWTDAEGDPGELARGGRLESVADLAGRRPDLLTDAEASWITASTDAAEADEEARVEAAERDQRQNRRLRGLLAAAAALLIVAVIGAALTLVSRNDAVSARDDADVERMVAQSAALLSSDADRAMLLAIEANRRRDDVVTQAALQRVIAAEPRRTAIFPAAIDGPVDSEVSADGRVGLSWALDSGDVAFFDTQTGEVLARHVADGQVFDARLTTDGGTAVLSTDAATLQVVHIDDGLVREIDHGTFAGPVTIARDGMTVAAHSSAAVTVYDVRTGEVLFNDLVIDPDAGFVESLGLSPTSLVVSWLDFSSGTPTPVLNTIPLDGGDLGSIRLEGRQQPTAMAFDDGTAVLGFPDGDIVLVDVLTGAQDAFTAHTSEVAAVSLESGTVVSAGGDGQVSRWTADGEPQDEPIVVAGDVHLVAGTTDGQTVVVLADGRWQLFAVGVSSLIEERIDATFSQVHPVAGWYVLPGEQLGIPTWRSLEDRSLIASLDLRDVHPTAPGQPFASADGRWVLTFDVGPDPRFAVSDLFSDRQIVADSNELYAALAGVEPEFGGFVGTARPIDERTMFAATEVRDGRFVAAIVDPESLEVLAGPIELPGGGPSLVLSDRRVVLGAASGDLIVISAAMDAFVVVDGGAGLTPRHEHPETGDVVMTGIDGQVAILSPDLTLRSLDSVVGSPYSAAFSPDGSRIAIATLADGVQLVDVASGRLTGQGVGGTAGGEPGRGVSWTADGSSVWVAPTGGPIRIAADPARWRDIACSIVNRELTQAEWERFVGSGDPVPACE